MVTHTQPTYLSKSQYNFKHKLEFFLCSWMAKNIAGTLLFSLLWNQWDRIKCLLFPSLLLIHPNLEGEVGPLLM